MTGFFLIAQCFQSLSMFFFMAVYIHLYGYMGHIFKRYLCSSRVVQLIDFLNKSFEVILFCDHAINYNILRFIFKI